MRNFNIETETKTVDQFNFSGQQKEKFDYNKCERVFRFRFINGNVRNLPKYILNSIEEAGYTAHYLGGTTYSHSVIGLAKKSEDNKN